MEITLTVHVPRRRPHPVDVVVEWSGRSMVAELCAALAHHLGEPVPGLSCGGRVLPPDGAVGMPPLLHGASVCVTTTPAGRAQVTTEVPDPRSVLDLVVVGGPDAGRRHPLSPPGVAVGRAPGAGLVVDDESLSRSHLHVAVGSSGVTVEDRASTNGVVVDGSPVDAVTPVDATSTIVIGSTTLRLRRAGGPGPPARHPGDGTVRVSALRGSDTAPAEVRVTGPPAPQERQPARVPWLAAVAPVPVAIALAFFLGPQLLLFAALGPVSLLAGALGDRWGSGRARRRELAAHALALERARATLADALRSERERLDRAHPDPAAVLATAERRLGSLWSGGGTARVRLGLGDVPTRVVWVDGTTLTRPAAAHAPLVVDLAELSCLGVVGSSTFTDGHLANLVGQLCTANAPHELSVSVASAEPQWSWVARLPHTGGSLPQAVRSASRPFEPGHPAPSGCLRLLVVPRPGPRSAGLVRAALADGVVVLVAAPTRAELPAGCRAVVHRVADGYTLDGPDGPDGPVAFVPDLVAPWWVDRLARALAPVRCADPRATAGMPTRLTLADALGGWLGGGLTADAVAARWRAREVTAHGSASATSSLAAVVGSTPQGPFVVDLCRDGPHVLVGGTTGSGKSEFLRTLVTSLAVSAPPEELTFVLVDFKGGAAFGPCAGLPHVVGLVTDLDDHLVSRALSSLRAELRRRERILATVGAGDLEGYQRLRVAGSEPVPRLVVVVDELRALVEELPEFVTGLVRLAALGRSLGVHLVLATQRPSGALNAEVQANVSLRIAFRMRDRADSVDVLDDGAAAGIAPSTPGRALARGADGSLVTFQSATVAAPRVRTGVGLTVRSAVGRGASDRSTAPSDEADHDAPSLLVAVVRDAHRLRGGRPPRSPWMAPLPPTMTSGDGSEPGEQPGLVGLVDEPDLQRVTPLRWNPTTGAWLLAGGAGSGRTTALRALALAAARRFGPESLHLHVIDGHGSLADLGALPHLGTSARVDDVRACTSLVQHLRAEVDRRLLVGSERPGDPAALGAPPTILLLVDGWEQLVEAHPAHGPEHLTATLLRVLRDGRSAGVVGAVAGGRALLHPRWGEVAGRTFLMGRIDPLDAALAGLRAADAPREPPPGRAVRVHDRREVQFAQVTPSETATFARGPARRPAHGAAWRWVGLPTVVRREQVPPTTDGAVDLDVDHARELLLGVGGEHATSFSWHPETDGRRLLVVGPPRSGRTNALRVIAESLCARGQLVAVVAPVDSGRVPWPAGSVVIEPGDISALVRLRQHHRDLALCVDDADRLGDHGTLPVLREICGLVDRDEGLLVVASSPTALATRFSGLDVEVARDGCGLVLNPTTADRSLLSATMPDGIPRLPGRGVFAAHGDATEVQVLLAGASVGQVTPREHLGLGLPGRPRRADAHQGHHEHGPADRHPGALDQADTHRQEDRVPHDGGGTRP